MLFLITPLLVFVLTLLIVPIGLSLSRWVGLVGVDVHKRNPISVPETAALLPLLSALWVISGLSNALQLTHWTPVFLVVFAAMIVGIVDDFLNLGHVTKALTLFACGYLLTPSILYRHTMYIPLIGVFELGFLYPLFIVPLAVTTAANFTNIYAGYNGLEAGSGAIAFAAQSIICSLAGYPDLALLAAIFAAVYFGLLVYNAYPARCFIGDTGTLPIGAAIAAIAVLSGTEGYCMLLLLPHTIDFSLKFVSGLRGRKHFGDTRVLDDGILQPPPYKALAHLFTANLPLTENKLVAILLGVEAVFSLFAIGLCFLS